MGTCEKKGLIRIIDQHLLIDCGAARDAYQRIPIFIPTDLSSRYPTFSVCGPLPHTVFFEPGRNDQFTSYSRGA